MRLSKSDQRLLDALQEDATRSQTELAEIAGLSRTSCWRRVRDLRPKKTCPFHRVPVMARAIAERLR